MSICQQEVERSLEKQFTFGLHIPLSSIEQVSTELILREEPQSPSNFDQLVKPTPFKKQSSDRILVKKAVLNRQHSFNVSTKSGESTSTSGSMTTRSDRNSTKPSFAKQAFGPSVRSIVVSPKESKRGV